MQKYAFVKHLCISAALLIPALFTPSSAHAALATFENFPEGSLGSSFTDPVSGIEFFLPTSSSNFFVDFATQINGVALPPLLPTSYLTGSSFKAGNDGHLGVDFGFTAELPEPTTTLVMDLIYADTDDAALDFLWATPSGEQSELLLPLGNSAPFDGHAVKTHFVGTFDTPIQFFTVSSNVAIGYDNIGAPEPGMLPMFVTGLMLFACRRRNSARLARCSV
jgi:hypothetical protein